MATHASIHAWKIPWTEEPGRLQSTVSQRIRHDWVISGNSWASLVAQNPHAMQETWVWSLGKEDLLEKNMATHSSILVWRISWTEEPGGLQSVGLQRVRPDWATNTLTSDKLQDYCFYLENGCPLFTKKSTTSAVMGTSIMNCQEKPEEATTGNNIPPSEWR